MSGARSFDGRFFVDAGYFFYTRKNKTNDGSGFWFGVFLMLLSLLHARQEGGVIFRGCAMGIIAADPGSDYRHDIKFFEPKKLSKLTGSVFFPAGTTSPTT